MDLCWQTLDLGVELECGDHVWPTSDLEAPVTEVIDVDQVVAIVTDGLENASREHTFADVARLVAERTGRGWAFIYLAAGFDAFEQGQRMHFDTVGCWKSDPDGVKQMWKYVGGNLISHRTKAEMAREYARKKFLDQVEEDLQ